MDSLSKRKLEQNEQSPTKKQKSIDVVKQQQASDQLASQISEKSKKKKGDIVDLIFEISQKNKDTSKNDAEKRENTISYIYGRTPNNADGVREMDTKIRDISNRIHSHENILILHEINGMILRYALRKNGIFDEYYSRYINPSKQKIRSLKNEYEKVLTNFEKFMK